MLPCRRCLRLCRQVRYAIMYPPRSGPDLLQVPLRGALLRGGQHQADQEPYVVQDSSCCFLGPRVPGVSSERHERRDQGRVGGDTERDLWWWELEFRSVLEIRLDLEEQRDRNVGPLFLGLIKPELCLNKVMYQVNTNQLTRSPTWTASRPVPGYRARPLTLPSPASRQNGPPAPSCRPSATRSQSAA